VLAQPGRKTLAPPRVAVSGICTLRQDGGFAYLSDTCWTPCLMVIGAPDTNPFRTVRSTQ